MFDFKNWDFEEGFYGLIIYPTIIVLIVFALIFATREKRVIAYELGSAESKGLCVNVNVENFPDYTIYLVGMSYEDAVEFVKNANATIIR